MKKITLFTTMILFLVITIPAMAQVTIEVAPPPPPTVRVAVPLPPPIVFAAPPEVVVLPETEVYVVPAVPEEIFFFNGYWWRPWSGRWYRSLRYDGGWGVYGGVPGWYGGIYPGWRENYRLHSWGGHPWNYHYISHGDLNRNWRTWHNTGYWNRPEHREFTHHHDGKVYTASHQDRNKGAGQANVNKTTTGAGQGRTTNKTTTQANVNKTTTGQGNKTTTQGTLNKGTANPNVNKSTTATGQGNRTTTQGTLNKGTTTTGQGHVGAGGHGATGNVHSSGQTTTHSSGQTTTQGSGQATKGQHN